MAHQLAYAPALSTSQDQPLLQPLRERFGVCQWFHFQDYAGVEQAVAALHELGVTILRTGISWADFLRPGGKEWYDWQMSRLAGFEILLSVWHTPPSLSRSGACSGPPVRLRDYADFVDHIITLYGRQFHQLELWNEPNNRLKWDFPRFDPQWHLFAAMIGDAAYWAKRRGIYTVLGGMIPVDPHWLNIMRDRGVMKYIDAVGIHAFPGMWFPDHPNWDWCDHWQDWNTKTQSIARYSDGKPVWVTETGIATFDLALHREAKYELQVEALNAATGCADRVYWYSAIDLDADREAIEGFHVDENEYHMGLMKKDGYRKMAFHELKALLLSRDGGHVIGLT